MGILKGLLSSDGAGNVEDDVSGSTSFAGAEAALDRAIQEMKSVSSTGSATDVAASRSSADRRQADGPRPEGLPDRRSGQERRIGGERRGAVEFGRRR